MPNLEGSLRKAVQIWTESLIEISQENQFTDNHLNSAKRLAQEIIPLIDYNSPIKISLPYFQYPKDMDKQKLRSSNQIITKEKPRTIIFGDSFLNFIHFQEHFNRENILQSRQTLITRIYFKSENNINVTKISKCVSELPNIILDLGPLGVLSFGYEKTKEITIWKQ